MSQMLRSQGETLDEATGLVQSHIKKNEPIWKLDYFDDGENEIEKKIQNNLKNYANTHINRNHLSKLSNGLMAMPPKDWSTVGGQSLMGMEHVLNGKTMGIYGDINKFMGGNYAKQIEELQTQADQVGIGNLNYINRRVLELVGGLSSIP